MSDYCCTASRGYWSTPSDAIPCEEASSTLVGGVIWRPQGQGGGMSGKGRKARRQQPPAHARCIYRRIVRKVLAGVELLLQGCSTLWSGLIDCRSPASASVTLFQTDASPPSASLFPQPHFGISHTSCLSRGLLLFNLSSPSLPSYIHVDIMILAHRAFCYALQSWKFPL